MSSVLSNNTFKAKLSVSLLMFTLPFISIVFNPLLSITALTSMFRVWLLKVDTSCKSPIKVVLYCKESTLISDFTLGFAKMADKPTLPFMVPDRFMPVPCVSLLNDLRFKFSISTFNRSSGFLDIIPFMATNWLLLDRAKPSILVLLLSNLILALSCTFQTWLSIRMSDGRILNLAVVSLPNSTKPYKSSWLVALLSDSLTLKDRLSFLNVF